MKRFSILLILTSIILSASIINLPYNVELATSSISDQDPTWTIEIDTSITNLNENKSKLSLTYTLTFSESVTLAYKTIGGNILSIGNDNYYWVPYTASQYVSSNVYQAKGSYTSYYSVTFNKTNILVQQNFNSHDFVMNVNQSGIYTMDFQPERDYPSFKANITIQLEPLINVTIDPQFWSNSGPINTASKTSKITTTNVNYNLLATIIPFFVLVVSYVLRRKKIT